ncbi:MAG: hypothetical protein SGBAC_004792 [Bacillariaceae sp.]
MISSDNSEEEKMEFSDNSSTDDAENDTDTSRPRKRARLDASETGEVVAEDSAAPTTNNEGNITLADPTLLEHAKKRLSKWAARLFDPDRPRGLVQGPQTIPLNDEFLAAFGKREKEYDEKTGNVLNLDSTIASDDENDDDDEDEETRKQKLAAQEKKMLEKAAKKKGRSRTKVKVSNLAYRTSSEALTAACEQFGALVEVKLILDGDKEPTPNMQNSGRGYITFETSEDAEACIEGLKNLDGRAVRLTMANVRSQGGGGKGGASSSSGPPRPASALNRSLEKDISTICYRCGGVGHIEPDCPNPAKPKPCPLCGSTEHGMYQCPYKQICFNCGTPGHVSRACTYQRGLPRRVCCSICLHPGHHRSQCRAGGSHIYHPGVMDIMNGAKSLKWFHGLEGITCNNCGAHGHFGWECPRPKVHHLVQDNDLAAHEIQRATADSMTEQLLQQRSRNRGRDNHRGGSSNNNRRREVQSLPPNRSGGSGDGRRNSSNGRGYDTGSGNSSGGKRKSHGGGNAGGSGGNRRNNRGYDTNGGSRKRSRGY